MMSISMPSEGGRIDRRCQRRVGGMTGTVVREAVCSAAGPRSAGGVVASDAAPHHILT